MAPIHPSRTGEAGFTLTELLVVLAIIGLLMVAVPVLVQSAMPGTRSLAAARALADDLRIARGEAIERGAATAIRFDTVKQVYRLEPGDRARVLPEHVPFALARGRTAVGFYPDGSADGAELFVGEGARRHHITVEALTGRVAIDE
ncbi:MAG TPA: GspH/FimT family pseudopilin [Rhizomicrobium sp.]|jgi:prepilin-type N-terminal cleavage/methylation domain-containing protein|nr:GspH/FimT family pseudopilin [Rhizomicrobium sp.]